MTAQAPRCRMEQLISFDYAMSCIVSSVAEDGSGESSLGHSEKAVLDNSGG
jgi:hypothetical protein